MHTRWLFASVVVLAVAAGVAGAHGWAVDVDDQVVGDGSVVVGHVSLLEGGYLAVHVVEDGEPGRVLGYSRFPDHGEFEGVEIELEEAAWAEVDDTAELVAVVHDDDGDGQFDWPDGDAVFRPDDPVADRFHVRRGEGASARVVAGRQESDGNVTLQRVDMPAAGFVVLYEDADGERGEVVGVRHLSAGHHENVTVGVAPRYFNDAQRLYLVAGVHVDDGDGDWEPDADEPVRVDGAAVASSFDASKSLSSLPTPTPTATPEATPTPSETPEPTATPSPSPTAPPSPTSATSPGFGGGAMLAALAGALVALARRR